MKGIVVDFNDKYAIVLDKQGEFIKVKRSGNIAIGYEIDIESKVFNLNIKAFTKIASIAAAFVLVFGVSMGVYAYNTPCNYVNVDINPSIEFSVNVFDRVIDVKGLNVDAESILKGNSYKNLKIDKAVGDLIEAAVEEGFLGENSKNAVMITVSGKDNEKLSSIQKELVSTTNTTLEQDKIQSEVMTEKVTISKHDDAKELGISTGKLVLIEKLKEVNPEVKIEDYKDKAVKDILASIKETRKNASAKLGKNLDKADKGKEKGNNTVDKPKDQDDKGIGTGNSGEKVIKSNDKGLEGITRKDPTPKETKPQITKPKDPKPKDPKSEPKDKPPKDVIREGTTKIVVPENTTVKDKIPGNKVPIDETPKDKLPADEIPKGKIPEDGIPKDGISKDTKDHNPKAIGNKNEEPIGQNSNEKSNPIEDRNPDNQDYRDFRENNNGHNNEKNNK